FPHCWARARESRPAPACPIPVVCASRTPARLAVGFGREACALRAWLEYGAARFTPRRWFPRPAIRLAGSAWRVGRSDSGGACVRLIVRQYQEAIETSILAGRMSTR